MSVPASEKKKKKKGKQRKRERKRENESLNVNPFDQTDWHSGSFDRLENNASQ